MYCIAWGNGNVDIFWDQADAEAYYEDDPDLAEAGRETGVELTEAEARERFGTGPHVSWPKMPEA